MRRRTRSRWRWADRTGVIVGLTVALWLTTDRIYFPLIVLCGVGAGFAAALLVSLFTPVRRWPR